MDYTNISCFLFQALEKTMLLYWNTPFNYFAIYNTFVEKYCSYAVRKVPFRPDLTGDKLKLCCWNSATKKWKFQRVHKFFYFIVRYRFSNAHDAKVFSHIKMAYDVNTIIHTSKIQIVQFVQNNNTNPYWKDCIIEYFYANNRSISVV